jgi:hypothetical protein
MCGAYGFSVKDAKEVYNRFDIENTLEIVAKVFRSATPHQVASARSIAHSLPVSKLIAKTTLHYLPFPKF